MIKQIINKLEIPGKLIYLSQYGSHLYGLNTENSDLDFRGVYIPALEDIILHKDKDEINTELTVTMFLRQKKLIDHTFEESDYEWTDVKKKVDVKIFSLQKFIKLCAKADTNALDLLFSYNPERKDIQQYVYSKEQYDGNGLLGHPYIPFIELLMNRGKLINTDSLESPITYSFKQATKYGLKGERLNILTNILQHAQQLKQEKSQAFVRDLVTYEPIQSLFDDKHLKTQILDNKGTEDYYLYVCGVQHQFNLELDTFINRIEEKINKEYTSQRTKDAADGNDWKALSHAIRILLEIKELLDTGTIRFPLKDKQFLLDIKLGKLERKYIDNFFNQELSNILETVQKNQLNWKYNEQFWNDFIIKNVKE